jgi:hypothetical protein
MKKFDRLKTHLTTPTHTRCQHAKKGWYEFLTACGGGAAGYMTTPCGEETIRYFSAVHRVEDFKALPASTRCVRCDAALKRRAA